MSEYSPYHLLQSPGEVDPEKSNISLAHNLNQEFNDVQTLVTQIKGLYLSPDCSDVTLIVEERRFPAHKTILSCRSEYFRAMFFGGMKEGKDAEVVLHETSPAAFEILLNYFYSGKLRFSNMKLPLFLEVFALVHQYGIKKLEDSMCEYLKHSLQVNNVAIIYSTAYLFALDNLMNDCLEFMDKNAVDVMNTEAFLQLSGQSLLRILSRNSFCAPELLIFQSLTKWIYSHPEEANMHTCLLKQIRLTLIKLEDIMENVRPTNLMEPERVLDAIHDQITKRTSDLGYRGFRKPNTNVISPSLGTKVIEGSNGDGILKHKDDQKLDIEKCTSHEVGADGEYITVELGRAYILNYIELHMVDRDQRLYSYYIEVSMDGSDWVRVINYSQYYCRGKQKLYFPERVVKYIRIMCTRSTVHRMFYISEMKAMYCPEAPEVHNDVIVPVHNVATIEENAHVIEGVSRSRNALLNGITDNYDWDNGYTCHQLGSGFITVQLPQPYIIGSIRLLLWDCDDRRYWFTIEVSHDNEQFMKVIDGQSLRSWQTFYFKPLPVVFIKITGLRNTANEVFHLVHIECPADPDNAHQSENVAISDVNTYPVIYTHPDLQNN
ncbi:unnamed protein product [Bursaphelenchus xylophilus]|uniref:(pine wood nematode) hypothetical protein n=1 Tax=Bursaphelenchus xylophilus TaxID=6326 RepID=A0A1I7RNG8_BURXY|nr:unnamed protein product [Bursaphelenchus xylophilus]CAG9124000.1 unnamed protein product [Bursaphelenchus xylophilus]